jgi:hypothetical protein
VAQNVFKRVLPDAVRTVWRAADLFKPMEITAISRSIPCEAMSATEAIPEPRRAWPALMMAGWDSGTLTSQPSIMPALQQ